MPVSCQLPARRQVRCKYATGCITQAALHGGVTLAYPALSEPIGPLARASFIRPSLLHRDLGKSRFSHDAKVNA